MLKASSLARLSQAFFTSRWRRRQLNTFPFCWKEEEKPAVIASRKRTKAKRSKKEKERRKKERKEREKKERKKEPYNGLQ